jgi:lipid-A-disaccharide synthase
MTSLDGRAILVSAGEPSGDLHGAPVVAALRGRFPGVTIEGCGGPRMAAMGLEILAGIDQLSAMGFLEVVRSIPRHALLLRRLTRRAAAGRYRLAILIDYPGFHLRLGRALRRAGVPVIQYVAPQLWAWRPGRLVALQKAVSQLAVILPFEADWFEGQGVPARFVGHPLLDRNRPDRNAARASLGLALEERVLGIFPGSRNREIGQNWALFRAVATRLLAEGRCTSAVVAGTRDGEYPEPGPIRVVREQSEMVMAAATAALIKSGTTTLEAALADTPMVVGYRAPRSTYAIARRLMTVDRISLVNLVAGEDVVPEFWHLPISASEMADALAPLLDSGSPEHRAQLAGLEAVRHRLGSPGAASRVVDLAGELPA